VHLRFVKFMKLPNVLFSSLIITIADFLLSTFLYGLLRKVSVNRKTLSNAFKKKLLLRARVFSNLMIHRTSLFFRLRILSSAFTVWRKVTIFRSQNHLRFYRLHSVSRSWRLSFFFLDKRGRGLPRVTMRDWKRSEMCADMTAEWVEWKDILLRRGTFLFEIDRFIITAEMRLSPFARKIYFFYVRNAWNSMSRCQ